MVYLEFSSAEDVTAKKLKLLEDIAHNDNTVVLHHANWCGHCQVFKPEWELFKKGNKKVNIVSIESGALNKLRENNKLYKRLTPKTGGMYFPMIVVYLKKQEALSMKKFYNGDRSATELSKYIDSHIKLQNNKKVRNVKVGGTEVVNQSGSESIKKQMSLTELNNELDRIIAELNAIV